MYDVIQYKCRDCNKSFFLFASEVEHNERESRFLTCSFHGSHKDIIVVNRFGSIREMKEHMERKDIYAKRNGRTVRKEIIH